MTTGLALTGDLAVTPDVIAGQALRSGRIGRWLDLAVAGGPAVLGPLGEGAMPLAVSLLAGRHADGRVWVVCPDARLLDRLATGLDLWSPDAVVIPDIEIAAHAQALPDPDILAERLEAIRRLQARASAGPVLVTAAGLRSAVPAGALDPGRVLRVARNQSVDPAWLAGRLAGFGYERVTQVAHRMQFAVRGGIVDVFSPQLAEPSRIEFFGSTVESIRSFDIHRQTTTSPGDVVEILAEPDGDGAPVGEALVGGGDLTLSVGGALPEAALRIEGLADGEVGAGDPVAFEPGSVRFDAGDLVLGEQARRQFFSQIRAWRGEGWDIHFVCAGDGEITRIGELFAEEGDGTDGLGFLTGSLAGSFVIPDARLAVLSDAGIFGRHRQTAGHRRRLRRASVQSSRAAVDFHSFEIGDHVVHAEQGIAIYRGMTTAENAAGIRCDALELEFAGEARLFVPVEHAYLVGPYVGLGRHTPRLSALGGNRWGRARRKAEQAVFDYAASLLDLHAERESVDGHAFGPDTRWQEEFEAAFPHTETPDQLKAVADCKRDMESPRPMDRLICGDVGFGKTEVAIRAAFKAVMGGKQAALLVPTTVLAQQHIQTLSERLSDYPVAIRELSRFVPPSEQRATIRGLADGSVDIVVGTHRLLSRDVAFKDLGLVIVDEEQRFGVRHKDRLKERFRLIDVLSLSATPIPRTLYLSLMGARDMSVIETPPPNRLPVETVICPYDERVIRDAVGRELARGGQVFFLHNRVGTIDTVRRRLAALCPDARIDVGHGQMGEDELEDVMHRFVSGRTDVLIATTIIESGLDIPNANTILIDRADRFGLADLYQLRGRVGRAQSKAYAYFLLPRDMVTRTEAGKRIAAIRQYSELGAGFRVAMRDLEIRGAGNLLGTAQSGHIMAVGFDLYCRLLRQAIGKLKGETRTFRADTPVDLDFVVTNEETYRRLADEGGGDFAPAFVPADLLPEPGFRIRAYRELAEAASRRDTDALRRDWRDRFGLLPAAVDNLITLAEIRISASGRGVGRVECRDGKLMITRHGGLLMPDGRFPRLTDADPNRNLRKVLDMIVRLQELK